MWCRLVTIKHFWIFSPAHKPLCYYTIYFNCTGERIRTPMSFNSLGFGDRHLTIEVTPVDISDSDEPLTHGIEYDFHALTISKGLPFVFVTSTPLNHNYSALNPHYHPDLMPHQHFPFKVTFLCG